MKTSHCKWHDKGGRGCDVLPLQELTKLKMLLFQMFPEPR